MTRITWRCGFCQTIIPEEDTREFVTGERWHIICGRVVTQEES